uniref:Zinc finger, HIT-type containing 1 n=2 Tax=Mastacembelus armatus TaxID=205130 RepID=A0A3Q3LR90_9TELE
MFDLYCLSNPVILFCAAQTVTCLFNRNPKKNTRFVRLAGSSAAAVDRKLTIDNMVLEKKVSARVEAGQRRVLDEATRQRRLTRQLEALEKDNFQDDPLSSLPPPGPTARLPAFSETEEPEKKKRKTRGDHFKQRFRKNFTTLLEEENLAEKPEPNYLSAAAPPSSLPPRHFCCVCGFPSHYTCTTCGGRYCSSKCLCTHRETRCLKWTL